MCLGAEVGEGRVSGRLEEGVGFGFGEMQGQGDFDEGLPLMGFANIPVEPVGKRALRYAGKFGEPVDAGVRALEMFSQ